MSVVFKKAHFSVAILQFTLYFGNWISSGGVDNFSSRSEVMARPRVYNVVKCRCLSYEPLHNEVLSLQNRQFILRVARSATQRARSAKEKYNERYSSPVPMIVKYM